MHLTKIKLRELFTKGTVNGSPVHRYLIAKTVHKARIPGILKFSTAHYKAYLHPSELSFYLYQNRKYFGEGEALMKDVLRPGDVFVDAGANIGGWSLYAATLVGATGFVYAFEPHPKIAGYLQRNVDLNGFRNIKVFSLALGDKPSIVQMEEKTNDANNNITPHGKLSVEMSSLDTIMLEQHIRLLKIDAEGSELMILKGASRTLDHTEFVYLECWDTYFKNRGYRTADLFDILGAHGFKIDVPIGHGDEFHEDILAHR